MPDGVRLDKWLVFARFCKTRGLVQRLIARGQVSLNGAVVEKPSAMVRAGDTLAVVLGRVRRRVTVRALGDHRGSAEDARQFYDEPGMPEKLDPLEAALPLYR